MRPAEQAAPATPEGEQLVFDADPIASFAFSLVYYDNELMLENNDKFKLETLWKKWVELEQPVGRDLQRIADLADM